MKRSFNIKVVIMLLVLILLSVLCLMFLPVTIQPVVSEKETIKAVVYPKYTDQEFTEQVYELTDKLRGSDFIKNENLKYLAEIKLDDIIKNGYWSHYNLDGDILWGEEYLRSKGEQTTFLGENLGKGYNTPEDIVSAWEGSPTHLANIRNNRFTDIGIVCKYGKVFICVQRFSD